MFTHVHILVDDYGFHNNNFIYKTKPRAISYWCIITERISHLKLNEALHVAKVHGLATP